MQTSVQAKGMNTNQRDSKSEKLFLPAHGLFLLFESNLGKLPLEVVVERDDVTFVVKYDMELHLPGIGSEIIYNFVITNLKGLLYDG